VMNAKSWTCDDGQQMRHEDDYHNPYSKGNSESAVKGECCRESCHNVMNAKSWTCDDGQQMRDEDDFHNPYSAGTSEFVVKGECCHKKCYSVMKDRSLKCNAGMLSRYHYDYHEPSGGWEQSDEIIKQECCTEESHPPACLTVCVEQCGMPDQLGDMTSWCGCFNNACWAPPGMLDSCPETSSGEEDAPTKDEIIRHVYSTGGFQCIKPDFHPGSGAPNGHQLYCGRGMYVHRKNKPGETCKQCPAGKLSRKALRNRRCKKCGRNKYQNEEGSTACIKCPPGFNTKGQRGKKQCFDARTGKSMKQLGMYPYLPGWKNQS